MISGRSRTPGGDGQHGGHGHLRRQQGIQAVLAPARPDTFRDFAQIWPEKFINEVWRSAAVRRPPGGRTNDFRPGGRLVE
jgi:hypothetical protein